jgi:ribosome maturation factor RimP
MKQNTMNRLLGKYCKIVTKEPGEEKARVVTGTIKDVDNDAGFIVIESIQGTNCLSMQTIIAIKPSSKKP